VFRDRRIAAIGPASRVAVPASAVRVDGTGKFLIPGLIDSHVHLQYDENDNHALLRAFVANGITTVFSLGGNPGHLRLRDAVARGEVLGPAIMTSGPPLGDRVGGATTTTPDEIAAAVVDARRAGYDFVKMTGDLSRETYNRLVSAARQEHIRLIAHAPRNLGATAMFEERQQAVAHVEEYIYAWFFYRRPQQHPIPDVDA
jgi:imidazolonepropionase-like amidohydrolase